MACKLSILHLLLSETLQTTHCTALCNLSTNREMPAMAEITRLGLLKLAAVAKFRGLNTLWAPACSCQKLVPCHTIVFSIFFCIISYFKTEFTSSSFKLRAVPRLCASALHPCCRLLMRAPTCQHPTSPHSLQCLTYRFAAAIWKVNNLL